MLPDDVERLALLGWHLYPRAARHRAAAFRGASELATCDLDQLAAWAREFPDCGWQAVCGPSGVWALDVDAPPKADGISAVRALVSRHGPLPRRPTVRTGGGGWLLVFAAPTRALRGQPLVAGVDPRRGRQSITVPPTVHHATGRPYRWCVAPWEHSPPPAPGWLIDLLAVRPLPEHAMRPPHLLDDEQLRRAVSRCYDRLITARPGTRNVTLNRCAYRLGRLVRDTFNARDAEAVLLSGARRIGLPDREALATIRSGIRAGARG